MKMSNKRKGILSSFFQGKDDYMDKLVPIFVLSSLVFMFSIFIGYALGDETSAQSFEGVLSNIPDPTESSRIEMFAAILSNNIVACSLFVVSGLLGGVLPLMFMAFNGFFIGYISWNVAQVQGLGFVFTTILPHGIIEIPTILLSASMGVGLGYSLIHRLMRREGLQKYVSTSFRIFILRIIPLLVFAAGIETALIYLFVI
jgi:stage II sporulation protein M